MLSPIRGSGCSNTRLAIATSNTQNLVSKYNSSLK